MSDIDFDLLSARMAKALKDGEFEKALPMIAEIKASGRDYTPSLIYFEGFALENLGRLQEAEATYRAYMERAGKSGAYYNKALSRIVELENRIAEAAKKQAEDAANKARAAEESQRKAAQVEREAAEKAARIEAAKTTPGATFKDCDICPQMVVVPPGSFVMGSPSGEYGRDDDEGPQHTVTIPKMFAAGVLEVTHGQFGHFIRETGYRAAQPCKVLKENGFFSSAEWVELPNWPNASYAQSADYPAVCIGWPDAKAYVEWLSKKTGERYRLLTEAEWEYAARAGTQTTYFYGNDDDGKDICRHGNTSGGEYSCTNDGYRGVVAPVGKFRANKFGLKDVIGNASEWVEDCYVDTYDGAPSDGSARQDGPCTGRVTRSGSYNDWIYDSRSANRGQWLPNGHGFETLGLRVARDVK